jgi:hypothetical protein
MTQFRLPDPTLQPSKKPKEESNSRVPDLIGKELRKIAVHLAQAFRVKNCGSIKQKSLTDSDLISGGTRV